MSLGSESREPARGEVEAPRAGEVLAGKYEVEGVIGAGGMGVVVSARHLGLGRRVAVKLLHGRALNHGNSVARFLREARAAASLRSEHVAQILDVDRLDGGEPYMVMEYLAGASLSKVIRERAPLPIDESVDYLLQACEAMAEAHALGIVHRDLKPGNMFVTTRPDGSPLLKVLDFGISKMTEVGPDGKEESLTATNMILGSPQYASPEQLRSLKTTDHRTDIWALGVILYYMLAGRRPFEGESLSALFLAIGTDPAPPLHQFRPEVPPDLEALVMRCLEKDREKRVQSIAEIARGLQPFAPAGSRQADRVARVASVRGSFPDALVAATPGVVTATHGSNPSAPSGTSPSASGSWNPANVVGHTAVNELPTGGTRRAWVAVAAPKKRSTLAIQIGAAVAAAALVVGLLLARRSKHVDTTAGDIEAISTPRPDTPVATATQAPSVVAPPPAPIERSPDSSIRGVAPATAQPAPPPQPDMVAPVGAAPDGAGVATAGKFGVAARALSLLERAGGGRVVGEVPKGEYIVVTKEAGDWVLIAYGGKVGVVMGWAPRSGVRAQNK